ncbi:hypothetical protein Dcar01_03548 [Deinococcus carri]|uniref:Uncharacterized protein n=1 Tax=Deinococcus carri TaxID=1211323 RepID=A0ABP9WBT3_9DEIO
MADALARAAEREAGLREALKLVARPLNLLADMIEKQLESEREGSPFEAGDRAAKALEAVFRLKPARLRKLAALAQAGQAQGGEGAQ